MKLVKEWLPYLIVILVVVLVRTFIVTPVFVNGVSMFPTLNDKQLLLLNKFDKKYERYEIVVLVHEDEKLIKRVMGLPSEKIEYKTGKLFVNGVETADKFSNITADFSTMEDLQITEIPADYYLVLGDNRTDSLDSRVIGLVSKKQIKGSTKISLFPFATFGKIEKE